MRCDRGNGSCRSHRQAGGPFLRGKLEHDHAQSFFYVPYWVDRHILGFPRSRPAVHIRSRDARPLDVLLRTDQSNFCVTCFMASPFIRVMAATASSSPSIGIMPTAR